MSAASIFDALMPPFIRRFYRNVKTEATHLGEFVNGGWTVYAEAIADGAWDLIAVPLLKVILISIILCFVVLSSTAVYMAFYQFYVPSLGATYDLHFDFANKSALPSASVPIELARNQEYEATVTLELPESPVNYQIGMFMVKLLLHPDDGSSPMSSARPFVVHYKSELLLLFETIFFALPLVLGFAEQRQVHSMKVNPNPNPTRKLRQNLTPDAIPDI